MTTPVITATDLMRVIRHTGLALLITLAAATLGQAEAQPRWTASWGAAMVASTPRNAADAGPGSDVTYRQIMRLSAGGKQLRVRVSNIHGDAPLSVGAASIAPGRAGSDAIDISAARLLRFHGAPGAVIAPGAEVVSDIVGLDVRSGQDVAVSLHTTSQPQRQSIHVAAHATQFRSQGDHVTAATMEGAQQLSSWYYVSGIEVLPAQPTPVLVAAGDSLTDGSGSGKDANERWTDWLQHRIINEQRAPLAVINAGIGGNQMLRDGLGSKLLDRFERDVLQRPGVTDVVILIGINDLGRMHKGGKDQPAERAALLAALQDGWRRLAMLAQARGICIAAATLPAYGASTLYRPAERNDEDRRQLNQWIRTSALFDAVADFDRAVSDPAAPSMLLSLYDSGDGLHLSPAGYRALADAVPLDQLAACRKHRQPPAA
jgi:lysophospholipase L1-like esterase